MDTDLIDNHQWRAPILCNSSTLPSHAALEAQAESLARFAAISQQAGLVPIVEPDVDFSEDASLARSVEVHVQSVAMIYSRCAAYGVLTEGEFEYIRYTSGYFTDHARWKVP